MKKSTTLEDLFVVLGTTRSEIVAVARRSKAGRSDTRDMCLIMGAWNKLKTKKWNHLYDDYFALVKQGRDQAISEVNPLHKPS